jgi:putative ABC transport system permease protein
MRDLRLAVRSLLSTPVVTTVALLSLAFGIGANTAIFSLVDSLLLRALPVEEPGRLALVTGDASKGVDTWTNPIWEALRGRRGVFADACAWSTQRFNLSSGGETQFVDGIWASGRLFDTLGVPAMLGRTLTEADDQRRGGPDGAVAVISYSYWQRAFGGAADAVGRTLMLERIPFTIVGVTPPEFFGPEVGRQFDVAIPIGVEPLLRGAKESALDQRSWWWLSVMVRLKPGQTLESGTAALRGLQPQIRTATAPTDWRPSELSSYLKDPFTLVGAATGDSSLRRRYEQPLMTILVVVALVLLIACANIANLLLARAAARRHEWSIRLALGASRWRLVRLLLAESMVLAIAGAALGLVIARWASRLLVRQLSTDTSRVFLDLSLDWRVLAFTTFVAVVTALLFGTAPAFRASGVAPMEAIKEHGRGAGGGRRLGAANLLVVAQVALSLVLVVAAGLFVRTFRSLATLDLGFDADRVLVATINTQRTDIAPAERIATYDRVRQRAADLPGVAAAGVSLITPISGMSWNNRISVSGGVELSGRQRLSNVNAITPGWLDALGTRLVAGRDVADGDRAGAPPVALVNEAFARRFLGGASPLGHTIATDSFGNRTPPPPRQIVGVVADAVYRSVREPVPPTFYIPLAQMDEGRDQMTAFASLSVRAAAGSPAMLSRSVAAAIAAVHPDLAVTFRLLATQVRASLTQDRLVAILAGFFGALALLLAGLGLYGVTAYAVNRQRMEIGIRMALGAPPAGVVRLVLGRVGWLVAVGVVIGAGVSLWASTFVDAMLFGLHGRDPVTVVFAVSVLAAVGAAAGWLPAWRASRIDPAEVLREG